MNSNDTSSTSSHESSHLDQPPPDDPIQIPSTSNEEINPLDNNDNSGFDERIIKPGPSNNQEDSDIHLYYYDNHWNGERAIQTIYPLINEESSTIKPTPEILTEH
uniref:Uncharacterized protein n=1 Tax=Caenorhabditis tropicalis TaxID=1561998 RepID=A0A1I7UP03_9PELO